ncbi:MAG TPA: 23S rRNA pseudouridine synthase F, partial [Candidatus Paceibacterota bacterium]|nr:23S rRNA pseudouridine synthase F [Candidatus Paceibacterota bacterium]
TEGKKRQIRRMAEALHHKVLDLKRIRIMNILLGNTKEGEYRVIDGAELKIFLESLNIINRK